ncbi:Tautomerase/MIF superfamily [Xylaria digitata]|nr:Tautomerase/MIF superfamily [Xylaria digitata]
MLENPLRKSAKSSASTDADIRRPDSPVSKPPRIGPSFARRKALQSRPPDSVLVEGTNVMRSIDRPPPGDVVGRRGPRLGPDASRKRSAYFESEFAGPNRGDDPAKTRIVNESMVKAEIKTNVIVSDELAFITDLACHLSNRYQRPMSSIIITLHHGICMLFGGTFEPACTLTIHALPSLLQPVTNRRNAILIQRHLHETLGVVSTRSYVRFEVTAEENVAVGGKTLAPDDEGTGRGTTDQKSGMFGKPSKHGRRIMKSVKVRPQYVGQIEYSRISGNATTKQLGRDDTHYSDPRGAANTTRRRENKPGGRTKTA